MFTLDFPQNVSAASNSDVYYHSQSPFYLRNADLEDLEKSAANGFLHHLDATSDLSKSNFTVGMKLATSSVSVVSSNLQFGGLTNSLCSSGMGSSGSQSLVVKGGNVISGLAGNSQFDDGNWGDKYYDVIAVPDHTQVDQATLNQVKNRETVRKLTQNREAARKSRMRKKAYVQQLESSRRRLAQLEQDVKRAQQQSLCIAPAFPGDQSHSTFDIDYTRWLDEHQRLINDMRSTVNSHVGDTELQMMVENVMSHYDEIFRLKRSGAKSDLFHIFSGMWKTPVERCFMWLGGFRSSDFLKVLGNQNEPLTEQQLVGICNLQQSSQEGEDALSQGMQALQESIVNTLSSNSLCPRNSGIIDNYMGQMAIAMSQLATLENFLHQADLLRLQTLQQMHRILTTRQAARALLAINDYKTRFRALTSLWLARPNG